MIFVDKKYTASVRYEDEPDSYDERLYAVGAQLSSTDEVVVVNPIFDDWVLNYVDLNVSSRRCIVWRNDEHWFVKKFPQGWTRAGSWSKVNFDLDSTHNFDVIFISYDELNADENYARLLEFAPNAKRIHGVTGIHEAHRAAAQIATTDMVYIVDGDAYILDDWKFDFKPGIFDRDKIYIWKSKNPINDLEYGYGGIKLFPKKKLLINNTNSSIDMTTSLGDVNVIDKISNITAFNTDPFSAWRSAVRETAKLITGTIAKKSSDDDKSRLLGWRTKGGDRAFGEFALKGSIFGITYGYENINNIENLKLINDREWLKIKFKEEYPDAII
jgi:hypothetical protein